jgi:cell division septation protein DedD
MLAQGEPNLAATQPDQLPNQQEFKEQSAKAQEAANDSLNQALHDEVERTGIRMETPRQVELPEKTKTKQAGATSSTGDPEAEQSQTVVKAPAHTAETIESKGPQGKFTLQIGSHPNLEDARSQIVLVESAGVKAFVKAAEVKGIGLRYRVFLGGYESKAEAEAAGEKFKSQHLFESFIVSKASN